MLTSAIWRGVVDFSGLLKEHDPQVIIYDLAPPYHGSWRFLLHLRATSAVAGRRFVLTSTNRLRVQQVAGVEDPILEVIGKRV